MGGDVFDALAVDRDLALCLTEPLEELENPFAHPCCSSKFPRE